MSAASRLPDPSSKQRPLSPAPSSGDDVPCDFLEFLQQARQLSPVAALSVLGELLTNYEPGPLALAKAEPRRVQSAQTQRRAA